MRISMNFLKRMFHRESQVLEATSVEQKEVSAETASAEKAEQNVKRTVQSGRSMVEMLGVLAVIGVLSVAGIAGYQFAMNKYRANQIANELNLAGNQIAFALARPHQESFDLTLGSPFDEGTLSSGFAFTYGCGTDTTMTGCFADDTTYYETLSGLPEDLCKTVAQLTQNLSYLVEQRVNDTVDTMGTSCSGDNNELVLLFEIDEYNADDSAGGSGNPNDDLPTGGASPDEWPFLPSSVSDYCTKDEDCAGSYVACYHGVCVECLTDLDCQEGMYCHTGLCSGHKPECFTNADCAEDEYCGYGECFTIYPGSNKCNVDSDCPGGAYCNVSGMCSSAECHYDLDCQFLGKGTVCSNYKCYEEGCKSDDDCPMSGDPSNYEYCYANGKCSSSECYSNEDCSARGKGAVCFGGKCYAEGCKSDADCPLSGYPSTYEYCHADGTCHPSECYSDEDCSANKGTVCYVNKCYDACKSDADCPLSGYPSNYEYCWADGTCSSSECHFDEDCSARGKGTVCSGYKCYEEGCQSDSDCPFSGQSASNRYCHANGKCSSSECSSDDDCTEMNKGISCFRYKCYDACKSDAECQARDANYPYCQADGKCYYRECFIDADCPSSKGSQCIGNECIGACQSDADCEAVSSYLRYCLSNGVCNHSECRTNSECQTLNKGTKCVYDNVEYAYRCQE